MTHYDGYCRECKNVVSVRVCDWRTPTCPECLADNVPGLDSVDDATLKRLVEEGKIERDELKALGVA